MEKITSDVFLLIIEKVEPNDLPALCNVSTWWNELCQPLLKKKIGHCRWGVTKKHMIIARGMYDQAASMRFRGACMFQDIRLSDTKYTKCELHPERTHEMEVRFFSGYNCGRCHEWYVDGKRSGYYMW